MTSTCAHVPALSRMDTSDASRARSAVRMPALILIGGPPLPRRTWLSAPHRSARRSPVRSPDAGGRANVNPVSGGSTQQSVQQEVQRLLGRLESGLLIVGAGHV